MNVGGLLFFLWLGSDRSTRVPLYYWDTRQGREGLLLSPLCALTERETSGPTVELAAVPGLFLHLHKGGIAAVHPCQERTHAALCVSFHLILDSERYLPRLSASRGTVCFHVVLASSLADSGVTSAWLHSPTCTGPFSFWLFFRFHCADFE